MNRLSQIKEYKFPKSIPTLEMIIMTDYKVRTTSETKGAVVSSKSNDLKGSIMT